MNQQHTRMGDAPNPSGSNVPKASEDEIADWMEPGKRYSTPEIQDAFELSQSTANRRLNKAADEGLIEKQKPSHRVVFWVKPDDGEGGSDS